MILSLGNRTAALRFGGERGTSLQAGPTDGEIRQERLRSPLVPRLSLLVILALLLKPSLLEQTKLPAQGMAFAHPLETSSLDDILQELQTISELSQRPGCERLAKNRLRLSAVWMLQVVAEKMTVQGDLGIVSVGERLKSRLDRRPAAAEFPLASLEQSWPQLKQALANPYQTYTDLNQLIPLLTQLFFVGESPTNRLEPSELRILNETLTRFFNQTARSE